MNRQLLHAVDINPDTRDRWTVLIQVLENGHIQQSRTGNDFKRLIVTDTEGTKLTLLIYTSNLRFFARRLIPYRRYYVSNAAVVANENRFRISSYQYSWILNNRTLVEDVVEPIPPPLPCEFEFARFNDLHKYADSENLKNIRAVVLRCLPTVYHGTDAPTRRDIVVVDEEKKLMLLTLWNDFEVHEGATIAHMIDTKPMIFAMKLKVTTFNCLSLSTRTASGIMINPPVSEALDLHAWYNANRDELEQLADSESYKDHNLLLPYPNSEDFVSIATANASLSNLRPAWVKGRMTLSTNQMSFWFTACGNCHKSLDADVTWIVNCPSCMVESEVVPLSRLLINIVDGSGSIQSMLSSPEVEQFIPFTALELKDSEEMGLNVRDTIQTAIEHQRIAAFLRSFELTSRGVTEVRVTVVKAYKPSSPLTSPHASTPTQSTNQARLEEAGQSEPSEPIVEEAAQSKPSEAIVEEAAQFKPSEAIVEEAAQSAPSTTQSGTSTPAFTKKQGPSKLKRDNPTKKTKPSST